jgi:hypothetical protein
MGRKHILVFSRTLNDPGFAHDNVLYSGAMILALANRVPLPGRANPPQGSGSHQDPFVLHGLGQWMFVPPPRDKRVFINAGGRMLMKRVNRGADGWNDYITDLGPVGPAKIRLQAQEARRNEARYQPSQTQAAPNRGTGHRTHEARVADPRWYMEGGIQENDPMYDANLSNAMGAPYDAICRSLSQFLQTAAITDAQMAAKMLRVVADSDSELDLPPAAALLCAGWFSGEAVRHPRSLISSLLLLDLIQQGVSLHLVDKSPGGEPLGHVRFSQVKFTDVIEFSHALPHPMTGGGTVKKAEASVADRRKDLFGNALEEDRSRIAARKSDKRDVGQLNPVESREAEILMEWLSRKMKSDKYVAMKFEEGYDERVTNPDAMTDYSYEPARRPPDHLAYDLAIIEALTNAIRE